ncbi:MAG: 8-amino-7-oxononanoate synthase [Rhodocyclaceae bacterium]|nr:8-amino-7-oxononanoate synthase [Rhodocyclaceae bacterium]
MRSLDALIAARLDELTARGERRTLRRGDDRLIDVASNDYLGLARHPEVIERACAWTRKLGAGSRAARLVMAANEDYLALEAKLAAFKGTEAALLFATGFQANASVLPALFALAEKPLAFTDRLIHASLHQGCRAAGVREIRFRHNDYAHLEALLDAHPGPFRVIVAESVYSMDGDVADVERLAAISQRHGAILYLDEAHATGVLGPQGRGLSAALTDKSNVIIMGTLSKALGAAGAYVAGSRALIDWLVNACTGFVFSTAPAPAALGAADAALDLVPTMDQERARLLAMAQHLRAELAHKGIDTLASTTQIVPAVLGDNERALSTAASLRASGIHVIAMRPPTVPKGTARLRFSLSAALSESAFARLLDAVRRL